MGGCTHAATQPLVRSATRCHPLEQQFAQVKPTEAHTLAPRTVQSILPAGAGTSLHIAR